jgi:hypothetical protein
MTNTRNTRNNQLRELNGRVGLRRVVDGQYGVGVGTVPPKPGHGLYNLWRLYTTHPTLQTYRGHVYTLPDRQPPSIMDSEPLDASSLSSVYQPLDVLRLELQNEPAFSESNMPKDDHTLTFVPLRTMTPIHFYMPPCRCGTQALPEGSRIQCVPGEADDP